MKSRNNRHTIMAKNVLIIMSDTGGGHRSSAEAIAEALDELYGPQCRVLIADVWKAHTPFPINRMGDSYGFLVQHSYLWKGLFMATNGQTRINVILHLLYPLIRHRLKRFFLDNPADVVVCVHPLLIHGPLKALRQLGLHPPFVTVVTDLVSGHPAWYHRGVDLCLVPTEPARCHALQAGLAPDKVRVVGLPVGLKFNRKLGARDELRRQMGLRLDLPALLVVGGGEGMGRVFDVARAIDRARLPAQLVVVAGRNHKLRRRLEAVHWEIPTHVLGFVTHMPELMAASDVIITKAGPSTVSEALISGLPMVLSGYIPGQEEGNVSYVVQQRVGAFRDDPAEIARLLARWLGAERNALRHMAERAQRLGRPQAALDIARQIFELA